MLAYVLAIVIAIGSFSFYMAAFFVPEIHRRQDFVWSGLGLFYAVVLWFCAGRITGAVLLGQTVSVVLLGWLGWHTLELRRDLTPEAVRTPVTWADLQRWGQATQGFLRQYLKLGSVIAGLQAIAADLGNAIADLRNRTAGPRGIERPPSDVPPLKRSPAYEFETEAGQGESVPSEFAMVSTRARQAVAPRDRSPAEASPAPAAPAENAEATAPAPPPILPEAAVESAEKPEADLETTAQPEGEQATASGGQTAGQSGDRATSPPSSPPSEPSSTDAARQQRPLPRKATQPQAPARPNPVTGFAAWVGDVARGLRKPQPQRGVIEIPPRPPSIPRSPDAATDQPKTAQPPQRGGKSQPQRGVIDIPPRPPSIPRSPKPDADPPAAKSPPSRAATEDTNWVDGGEASADTANWPATNWPNEAGPTSPASAPAMPPASTPEPPAETNWPDDDDTNWPD